MKEDSERCKRRVALESLERFTYKMFLNINVFYLQQVIQTLLRTLLYTGVNIFVHTSVYVCKYFTHKAIGTTNQLNFCLTVNLI